MSGNHSRRKGAGFEREIVRDLNVAGIPARRNLGEPGGQMLGVDVMAAIYDIQAKRGRRYAPLSKLFEVPEQDGRIALLVTKADRQPALVALRWDHFLALAVERVTW